MQSIHEGCRVKDATHLGSNRYQFHAPCYNLLPGGDDEGSKRYVQAQAFHGEDHKYVWWDLYSKDLGVRDEWQEARRACASRAADKADNIVDDRNDDCGTAGLHRRERHQILSVHLLERLVARKS